ncbi:cellulose binding domain-containing protein [Streptomyces cellulosae]|uniref:cellulose binding domain-containing protein n=1 Tax=Streptomyces cellulosae TaxID=1968 RepID=UPI003681D432
MRDTRLLRRPHLPRPSRLPHLSARSLFGLLAALLLPLGLLTPAATAAAPPDTTAAADPVRIMPLGDSITGSPGCWRALLWNRLQDAGHTGIDFVGTLPPQGCGVAHDGDNEGHGGELVTNVASQGLLPARLAATRPDIVVMHFGTNDVWSNIAPDRILAAYDTLLAQMRASNPDMRVLVAQLIPMAPATCAECAQRVVDLNARIPAWAAGARTDRSPVVVVDQWTGFDTVTDTYDGVHPNAAGDEKIAARWFPALAAQLDSAPGGPGDPGDPEDPGDPGDPEDPGDPGDPGDPSVTCTASFRAVSVWQGGHQAEVTVRNTSAAPVRGWTVTLRPADGARVTQVWNGTLTTAADGTVTVSDAGWNGALSPGASTAFGLIATTSPGSATPAATADCAATPAS